MRNKTLHRVRFSSTVYRTTAGLFSLAALGLTACSSSVTPNYYTLAPRVVPTAQPTLRVIELLPVNLPDRLDRASLMINSEQGQAKILDNDRWTSNLAVELHDSLSAGLQQQLGAVDRYSSGMPNGKIAYRIATDFSRFDTIQSASNPNHNRVEVEVSWTIKPIIANPVNASNVARSLSCRMTFNQTIASPFKIPDTVNASRSALNRVITAISNTVIASEKGTTQVPVAICG
ncbi:PqiC family protein [Acinetobacter sp. MD2(2019)]|uniref:PqiC family protein n=1 Tax=Acinetobacter sp. MD2(2019) TaxID=2605273 RepID=UPI002D1E8F29|nr:PqiC family protein [Acinetobacter sp. MD2(2019)]MEB3752880.1 membrane integrity-associated transporter subunit PqiC [Acinetobacter sp. MD2(2019)]